MYKLYDFEELQTKRDLKNKLIYISSFCCNQSYHGRPHSHKFSEMFFFINGGCNFYVRDMCITLCKNDFIIIPSNVEHNEKSIPNKNIEYIVLGVENLDFSLNHNSAGYYKGSMLKEEYFLINLLNEMIKSAEEQTDYNCLCQKLFDVLYLYVKKLSNLSVKFENTIDVITPSNNNILWVKQYIDENFTKQINLDKLAIKIGLNKYSMIRSFKRVFNVSPINYMLDLRYKQSKFLLRTTNDSIKQIAEAVGFSSANYFSQFFQKHDGMTPSKYREIYDKKY